MVSLQIFERFRVISMIDEGMVHGNLLSILSCTITLRVFDVHSLNNSPKTARKRKRKKTLRLRYVISITSDHWKSYGGGRGGGERSIKIIYSCKGKSSEKNSCTPSTHQKYSRTGLEQIQAKEMFAKKNYVARKFPIHSPQRHNCSHSQSVIDGYRP